MTYEAMSTCAALVFSMAVEDYSATSGKSIEDVRRELIESKAYECLLNFDSGLWMEGPDYFREYYEKTKGVG